MFTLHTDALCRIKPMFFRKTSFYSGKGYKGSPIDTVPRPAKIDKFHGTVL